MIKVSVGIGQKSGQSEHHEIQEIPNVSHATAGGNLTLNAMGSNTNSNKQNTDGLIHLKGAQLSAYQIILHAANEMLLESAEETRTVSGKSQHSSGSVGIGLGIGGKQNGFTLDLAASRARGHENGESVTCHDTTFTAKTVSIKVDGDAVFKGFQATGERIELEAQNLHVESLQDKDSYHQKQQQLGASASICIPPYCTGQSSAGMSYQRGYIDNGYQSVKVQSGLYAGKEGYSINIKGNTQLIGGAIKSQATSDKNHFSTGTLETSDIKNIAEYEAGSSGISVSSSGPGSSFNPTAAAMTLLKDTVASNILLGEDHYAESQTKSVISAGQVTITDEKGQLEKTGKTVKETLNTLNRNTDNSHRALENTFDANKIKRTQELNQIKSDIVQQAAPMIFDRIGDYLVGQSPEVTAVVRVQIKYIPNPYHCKAV